MPRKLVGIGVSLALFAAILASQETPRNASVVGTITDATGAVLPGVALSLKQDAGNQAGTTTNERGEYRIANLPGGAYTLTASLAGFKNYAVTFTLKDRETRRQDIQLEVGATSESIMVMEAAPLLRTESAAIAAYDRVSGNYGGIRGKAAPHVPSREEYGRYVENEFQSPTKDPLSTFSVDVDTASYSNIRRFLRDGQLPPQDAVRVEELINYFSYDYPLPEAGKPVSMSTHLLRNPWNSKTLLLHVGLRTQPIATEDLPPSHLTFLIDVSGSMNSPDKLPLVQQALQMLVRQLRPRDTVAIAVYAGAAGAVLQPTRGSEQSRILEAMGRLQAGGSTNGAGGIRLAYQLARQTFDKRANNRVILATDGDFNVGVSSDDELVRLIEQERQSGVFLSVLGFGTGNLKDSKMEKLADHGNGTYAYIDSLSEARKVFVQEMGASLVTVAKDVKLQIEFNPEHVKEYRLVGYENRMLRPEDFNNDAKDAGDLGAGHQVTAFYEIVPARGERGDGHVDPLRYQKRSQAPTRGTQSNELAWVKLRHKAPQGDRSALLEWPVSARAVDLDAAPRDVRFAAAVAEFGLLLRHSEFAGRASFDHVLSEGAAAVGSDLSGHRTEFLDLVHRAQTLSRSHRGW